MTRNLSKKIFLSLFLSQLFSAVHAYAHCPLCTIGAGAVAMGASFLGIKDAATGIFIGAFATALGFWSIKLVKKSYVKYQNEIIILAVFISTVFPISQIIKSYIPFYINWGGGYGTILHRTYIINSIFFGSLIGAIIMILSPWLSCKIKEKFQIKVPFQTMIIIFLLSIFSAVILQFTTKSY